MDPNTGANGWRVRPRSLRMDLSFLRRRHNFSPTSSASLSPTVPVLQSPAMFQALTTKTVPEETLKQKNKLERAAIKPSMFFEEKEDDDTATTGPKRGGSADAPSVQVAHKSVKEEPSPQAKNHYFEDVFSSRGPLISPRTRISNDSIVVIEVKTNSRVSYDDSKLVSDLTLRLAQIYQKPDAFMMVTIQQDACLCFGNLSLPAYLMKVFALPYLIAPITNLRNTILIQAALQDLLQVAPNRGVVLYIPVSEENFATNGVTMMGEIARLERQSEDQDTGILRTISRSMRRRMKSSSISSVPLSVETTSSWAPGFNGQKAEWEESRSRDVSNEEGKSKTVKKSKSFRDFLSNRLSDLGSIGDVQ
ncbi:MIF domain protein [Aspergillus clavatus NRRL 1]|uniref:L-dopachrome isomerase n=1 Tax=Aspergillus clavatus (strain ATCC 1007 / CBS 513.65 / DSM 816 / NCTC 3887 / NRRL 1 / QM 1276 / 107) TaxID=344612 RepID=A1CNH6_ASPCL|nr:MIF domain protein [Aspergillus clavatus NRRL 1]EAW07197.1 MIF domain protein [Aspergillus clavatus NRRL 1]